MRRVIRYSIREASIPRSRSTSEILFLALMIALVILIGFLFKPLPEAADCPTGGAISVPADGFSYDRPIASSTP